MILLNNKIITDIPEFPSEMSEKEQIFITALLVEEHGVILDPKTNSYKIKSIIAKKGGYGNVVLDVSKRPAGTAGGRITNIPEHKISKDASDTLSALKSKYAVEIDSFITWSGSSTDKRVYTYAGFASFTDFIKYIKLRLQLPESLANDSALNKILASYSGYASNYSQAVRSLMKNIKIVAL